MARRGERGYVMLAAVAAVAAFGYLALAALGGGRSAVIAAGAELTQARLSAACDAGAALAIRQLDLVDPARRWRLVGPPHEIMFDGMTLAITVEDENGKAPINFLQVGELRRLFELGGADPKDVGRLVANFTALRGDLTPAGAPSPPIDPRIAAQRGRLTSIEELQLLPGMTPALYARIAPAVTVNSTTAAFDPRTASPLALAVMAPRTPPAKPAEAPPVAGHIVTVRVEATDGRGGRVRRTTVVDFTASAARPYYVRGLDDAR
jgi:general secretion pathway protein K